MLDACSEIIWLRGLFNELDFTQAHPNSLHGGNTSAIQISINPIFHERTKYIEVDCHSIREVFDHKVIALPHIFTALQIVDIFTQSMTC